MNSIKRFVGILLSGIVLSIGLAQSSEPTIVVYSPQGDATRGGFIARKAKEDLGIVVKFVGGGGGELTDRLLAEKNNPQADVVLGLIQPSMYSLKKASLFEPFKPSWASSVMGQFDPEHHFHMFWQTPIAIAYNVDKLTSQEAPKSWLDLAQPKYKDKFVLSNLGSQTTRAIIIGILWRFTDPKTGVVSQQGWDTLKRIFNNAYPLAQGAGLDWAKVKSGEIPIVLSWLGGIQRNATDNAINIRYVPDTSGTPFVMESVALMKSSKNAVAAKRFIEWFGSADFQIAYTNEIKGVTPINPKALSVLDRKVKDDVNQFSTQTIDWAVVSDKVNGWMEKIQLEIVK